MLDWMPPIMWNLELSNCQRCNGTSDIGGQDWQLNSGIWIFFGETIVVRLWWEQISSSKGVETWFRMAPSIVWSLGRLSVFDKLLWYSSWYWELFYLVTMRCYLVEFLPDVMWKYQYWSVPYFSEVQDDAPHFYPSLTRLNHNEIHLFRRPSWSPFILSKLWTGRTLHTSAARELMSFNEDEIQ